MEPAAGSSTNLKRAETRIADPILLWCNLLHVWLWKFCHLRDSQGQPGDNNQATNTLKAEHLAQHHNAMSVFVAMAAMMSKASTGKGTGGVSTASTALHETDVALEEHLNGSPPMNVNG